MGRRILTHDGKNIGVVSEQLFRPADRLNNFELRLAFAQALVHMISERKEMHLTPDQLLDRSLLLMAPGRGFDRDRMLNMDELSAKYGLPHALVVRRLGLPPESVDDEVFWAGDREVRREAAAESREGKPAEEGEQEKKAEVKKESPKPKASEVATCPDYLKTVVGNELFHWCNWLGRKEILLSKFHLVQYCMGDFASCPKRKF